MREDTKRLRAARRIGRRQRRLIQTTEKYQQIRTALGTGDDATVRLTRVGEVSEVGAGRTVNPKPWGRTHLFIGLTAPLAVEDTVIAAPWVIDDATGATELATGRPGLVMTIDRRYVHLVEDALSGRVEPVTPIVKAIRRAEPTGKPMATPAPAPA